MRAYLKQSILVIGGILLTIAVGIFLTYPYLTLPSPPENLPTFKSQNKIVLGSSLWSLSSLPPSLFSSSTPVSPSIAEISHPPDKEFGVWIWDDISRMSQDQLQHIIQSVADHHFNVIYLTIDEVLKFATIRDSKNLKEYEDKLQIFLSLAQQENWMA
jgi:hypothetical protein